MQFRVQSDVGSSVSRSFPVSVRVVLLAMAGIFMVIAVVFHFVVGFLEKEAALLAAEGQEAQAVVTGHRINETQERDREGRQRIDVDYYVSVKFTTAAGVAVQLEKQVSVAQFNALQTGDTIPIRYAASDPTVTEFHAGERAGDAAIFGWVSKGLGGVAVVLAGLGLYLGRRRAAVI